MGSTLIGISTIRACKANERLALEFDNLQNVHSSVWQTLMSINTGECRKAINDELGRMMKFPYRHISTNKRAVKKRRTEVFARFQVRFLSRIISAIVVIVIPRCCYVSSQLSLFFSITALGLWLDCVSCAFVASICFSFIVMNQQESEDSEPATTSSNVGLAISQALILTGMVQYGIRQMMESFQLFTNAERVLQYTKLEQEPLILRRPTRDWPFKGISVIADVRWKIYDLLTSTYFSSISPATSSLLHFNFNICDTFRKVWLNSRICRSFMTSMRHQLWWISTLPLSQRWRSELLEGESKLLQHYCRNFLRNVISKLCTRDVLIRYFFFAPMQNWRRQKLNHQCTVPTLVHRRTHIDWRHRHGWHQFGEFAFESINHPAGSSAFFRNNPL